MKILYIATSFPKPDQGATIYTDLADALHAAGHEITVVATGFFPESRADGLALERGYHVLRISTGKYYDVGLIRKGITALRMPFIVRSGIRHRLAHRKFDLVLFESPPTTNASLVKWAKRHFSCPSYLMLKDIFPQNAIDLGLMKEKGILHRYFRSVEKKLYRTADAIGCMSQGNLDYVLSHQPWIDRNKVELFPNTKKLADRTLTQEQGIRPKYGIPEQACLFLFGGNMGKPQYVELLCQAIERCKDDEGIFFAFIGRGTDRYKIEQAIEKAKAQNALLINNLPRAEYEQVLQAADVGLIILDPRFTIPNYPSRILSYMEYAKPVLAATDKASDIRDLIEQAGCGTWVWSGDADAFCQEISEFARQPNLKEMGMNGRVYIEQHFDVGRSVEILERAVLRL